MSERDGYQHGVPCWIDTWQPDADAAVAFYNELFGWEAEDTMPPGVSGRHYMCRLRGRDVAAVASRPEEAPPVTAWNTYVWVDDADRAAEQAVEGGGAVLKEPFDALDGGRIAIIADPAGAALGIWQPGRHRGAQLINEPGAWAMSMLVTPDPEGAKGFYADMFGWTTRSFGLGEEEITMFALPGYVGGEPQQPVPRDVVGTLAPPGAAANGTPPHWSVDFWVRDPDAAAEQTAALGGEVIAPPYDLPDVGMRQAVLADPEGATFSITRPPGLPDA
jgi:predicted enzyme related to lactoylglutathione lyase